MTRFATGLISAEHIDPPGTGTAGPARVPSVALGLRERIIRNISHGGTEAQREKDQ